MYTRISTKKIALCGVLTALAMIFSYIESVIPVPIPVPGIKLGVANIAVITILYVLGVKEAIVINLLRIVLTSLLFGNVNSFLFSISGAALSLTIMIIMKKLDFFSCIGVSVCGGVMHNIGQIIAAVFIMGSEAIVWCIYRSCNRSGIWYSCKACQKSSKLRLILTARKKSIK